MEHSPILIQIKNQEALNFHKDRASPANSWGGHELSFT